MKKVLDSCWETPLFIPSQGLHVQARLERASCTALSVGGLGLILKETGKVPHLPYL